jgi:diguanylate cyclase (GGDEF)-like protein
MTSDRPEAGFQTIKSNSPIMDTSKGQARKAFLTVIRGGGRDLGKHIVVERSVVVGRDPQCDLPLLDMIVSWNHCRITRLGGEAYIIEDLASTNGTHVDGGLVKTPRALREGEKIFVGETVLRFSMADEMDVGFHDMVSQLVSTDGLTGLPSKRAFDDALDYGLRCAVSHNQNLSILMMDMDGVKQINDTHGHLFGAYVIGQTGRLIARVLEQKGQACRFGGDEFTAFLRGYDKQNALLIGEQIRRAVETAGFEKDKITLNPTISIGVATYPEDAQNVQQLVAAADEALYRAKGAGKNRVST